jgi:acyl transferase domain-containing protein
MHPNPEAQEDLMRFFHVSVGLDPALTDYVEGHGTGTQAGDQVEITSISKVFCNGIKR